MTTTTGRRLALTAMIFAVAMTFIDQTIVSVAAPRIQAELGLTSSGLQWAINAYLLAMAALFAFGGRLADTLGHRRMVTVGVALFAGASALCGLTPTGGLAEGWLITFRALQGAGSALMYPAALAIVAGAYRAEQRGKALAVFFGVAGGLTAVGPALGGYLTAWTWRSIFWINIPIALVALVLVACCQAGRRPAPTAAGSARTGPDHHRRRAERPRSAAEQSLGLGQSADERVHRCRPRAPGGLRPGRAARRVPSHGRGDPPQPLLPGGQRILFAATMVFVPIFFFASEYGQIALGQSATKASLHAAGLLRRLRRRSPARRPDARPDRGTAAGRPRLRARCGRPAPLGNPRDHPVRRPPVDVHRAGRRRHGTAARPGQHRRAQPRTVHRLRPGDRHHPDGAQLRCQPRSRCARQRPGRPAPGPRFRLADCAGTAGTPGAHAGRTHRPAQQRRFHDEHPAVRSGRLRAGDEHRADDHVVGHGRGRRGRPGRSPARCPDHRTSGRPTANASSAPWPTSAPDCCRPHQPRARHSARCGRSRPRVVSLPWPG